MAINQSASISWIVWLLFNICVATESCVLVHGDNGAQDTWTYPALVLVQREAGGLNIPTCCVMVMWHVCRITWKWAPHTEDKVDRTQVSSVWSDTQSQEPLHFQILKPHRPNAVTNHGGICSSVPNFSTSLSNQFMFMFFWINTEVG